MSFGLLLERSFLVWGFLDVRDSGCVLLPAFVLLISGISVVFRVVGVYFCVCWVVSWKCLPELAFYTCGCWCNMGFVILGF